MKNDRLNQNQDQWDSNGWDTKGKRKRSSDLRMAGILLLAVILGGAVFFAAQGDFWPDRSARQNDRINVGGEDREQLEYKVLNPVPVRDSQSQTAGQNAGSQGKSSQSGSSNGFLMPVDGVVTKTHSPDTPVYSKTLDQYMVHFGIDIDTTLNTPVRAVQEGTVIKVYQDDKFGSSVWISHPQGLVSQYGNLTKERTVGEGDVVKAGDVIGKVGDTALLESLDISHLHFAMEQNGKPVDPLSYLAR